MIKEFSLVKVRYLLRWDLSLWYYFYLRLRLRRRWRLVFFLNVRWWHWRSLLRRCLRFKFCLYIWRNHGYFLKRAREPEFKRESGKIKLRDNLSSSYRLRFKDVSNVIKHLIRWWYIWSNIAIWTWSFKFMRWVYYFI